MGMGQGALGVGQLISPSLDPWPPARYFPLCGLRASPHGIEVRAPEENGIIRAQCPAAARLADAVVPTAEAPSRARGRVTRWRCCCANIYTSKVFP